MRVLWVCNIMLPAIAEHLHLEASNKEGWLTGLSGMILRHQEENQIELGVCFPAVGELAEYEKVLELSVTPATVPTYSEETCRLDGTHGNPYYDSPEAFMAKDDGKDRYGDEMGGNRCPNAQAGHHAMLCAYGFHEDVSRSESYDERTEARLREIIEKFKPDIVHCFGTEYPHTLAAVKAFGKPERTLIGIQGLCSIYAQYFRADLPDDVWKRITFRDRVRQDDLRRQHEKYVQRGVFEIEALQMTGHITGRTAWDRKYAKEWNPKAEYHFMNETMRSVFYEGCWEEANCQRYSVFLSQGDYPIKGLHYMLQAMPRILKAFPETELYVAGNSIIKSAAEKGIKGIKGKLKLESYGKYILQLLKETGTLEKTHFLGRLSAEQMKRQYLESNVFVCPSSIENSPNSVGEAMLLGVPTVCAEVGGIPSIFTGGVDGLLYPAGNVEKLAKAVMKMFAGGEQVKAYSEAERKHARKTHDAEENYWRLLEIYANMDARKELAY